MKEVYTIAEAQALLAKKRSKYGAKKTMYEGRLYDSSKEANFAMTLDLLKGAVDPAFRVVSWEPQVRYPLIVNGKLIATYVADFVIVYGDDHVEVIDVKSEFTKKLPIYRLKKKLMLAIHGIEIKEEI